MVLFEVGSSVLACPRVDNLVDFTCDGKSKIVFTGDSIVAGTGDTEHDNHGGYVRRVSRMLRGPRVVNLGIPGITSQRLFSSYKRNLRNPDGLTTKLSSESDIFIIAVGINDYWNHQSAALTVRNIKRLVATIREMLAQYASSPPFVVVATLTPTKRDFQQPFVEEVNQLLLRFSSRALPVYLRFDTLDPELLSPDGLHPNSQGYDVLGHIAYEYITGRCQRQMVRAHPS